MKSCLKVATFLVVGHLLAWPVGAFAQSTLPGNAVAVCDPTIPFPANHCLKPNADGSINADIGGAPVSPTNPLTVGGLDNVIPFGPTVQNAAYAASASLGGLQTVSAFRSTSPASGILDYISSASKGGSTVGQTVYAFNANPTGSTCTDRSAFVLASADLGKIIPGFPIVLTPATAQGITQSTASQSIVVSVNNNDGTISTNLYFCILANASVTPASTTDLLFNIAMARD